MHIEINTQELMSTYDASCIVLNYKSQKNTMNVLSFSYSLNHLQRDFSSGNPFSFSFLFFFRQSPRAGVAASTTKCQTQTKKPFPFLSIRISISILNMPRLRRPERFGFLCFTVKTVTLQTLFGIKSESHIRPPLSPQPPPPPESQSKSQFHIENHANETQPYRICIVVKFAESNAFVDHFAIGLFIAVAFGFSERFELDCPHGARFRGLI